MSDNDVSSQLFGPTTSVADQLFQNSVPAPAPAPASVSVADQLFSNGAMASAPSVADQLFGDEPDEEDDDLGMEDEDEDEDDGNDWGCDDDDDDDGESDDEPDTASVENVAAQLFGTTNVSPSASVADQLFGSSPEARPESVANQLFGGPVEAVPGMSDEAYSEGMAAFAASAFLADLLKPKVGGGVVFNINVTNLIIHN